MKRLPVFVLCCTLLATGCSVAWLSTLENYIKIAGPILIQILDIVSLAKGQPPNVALQAKISADQAAVSQLANSISAADSANLPRTCAAFNQAVSTLAGDLNSIEQLANIGPGTSGEIQSALGIAQAAIQEVEAPIQACESAPNPATAMVRLQAAAVKVTSPDDVVSRFNAVVDKKHHVHLHSTAVRWLTFGIAK